MICSCSVLKKFETCDKIDAAEHYADLLMAHAHAKPKWLYVNALLHYRFGEEGLKRVQLAARRIAQNSQKGKIA